MSKLMKINGHPGSGTLKKQQSSHRSCHSSIMDQISENKFKTEMVIKEKMLLKKVKEPSTHLDLQRN
jgi:hypothetical protein